MEVNYLNHSQTAKSGPLAGEEVSPAYCRAGQGERSDDVFLHAAVQRRNEKHHLVMVQISPAVRIYANKWDERPKGKFGSETADTGPWVFEQIGIAEWF